MFQIDPHFSFPALLVPPFLSVKVAFLFFLIRATTASAFQQTLALPPRQLVRIKMAIRHGRFQNVPINSAQ